MIDTSQWTGQKLVASLVALDRLTKLALMLTVDSLALAACLVLAELVSGQTVAELALTALAVTGGLAALAAARLYRSVTRYLVWRSLAFASAGLLLLTAGLGLSASRAGSQAPVPLALAFGVAATTYLWLSRLCVRTLLQQRRTPRALPVAIYGAGEAGAQLARAMATSGEFRPVCFFDEKRAFTHRSVAGLEVFPVDALREQVARHGIGSIAIALPSSSPLRMRALTRKLVQAGVRVRWFRNLLEVHEQGEVRGALSEIRLEHLLGRIPVPPDMRLFGLCVEGKSVLVTGAGGSIGSELCRQLCALQPGRLDLIDHSEFALYTITAELRRRWPKVAVHAHLGSVCNPDLLKRVIASAGTDTIYHAAAYKHVPIVEENVVEGIRNNVLGAMAVAQAAHEGGVATCVLVSSDKAVRPTNVMGASKRIAELVFQAAAAVPGASTRFSIVRFGNVLGSSGSVVPLFQQQIARGGPITITHPDVIRYFMLIAEAAQLVVQAGAMARGGEVFVLDMGEPVRILDLARTMIGLSGLTERNGRNPDGDIAIEFIGLFPGEKLYEELLIGDGAEPSEHPAILRVREASLVGPELAHRIKQLLLACQSNERRQIDAMLVALVPEFRTAPERPTRPVTTAVQRDVSHAGNTVRA